MGEARAIGETLTYTHLGVSRDLMTEVLKSLTIHLSDIHFKVVLVVQDCLC